MSTLRNNISNPKALQDTLKKIQPILSNRKKTESKSIDYNLPSNPTLKEKKQGVSKPEIKKKDPRDSNIIGYKVQRELRQRTQNQAKTEKKTLKEIEKIQENIRNSKLKDFSNKIQEKPKEKTFFNKTPERVSTENFEYNENDKLGSIKNKICQRLLQKIENSEHKKIKIQKEINFFDDLLNSPQELYKNQYFQIKEEDEFSFEIQKSAENENFMPEIPLFEYNYEQTQEFVNFWTETNDFEEDCDKPFAGTISIMHEIDLKKNIFKYATIETKDYEILTLPVVESVCFFIQPRVAIKKLESFDEEDWKIQKKILEKVEKKRFERLLKPVVDVEEEKNEEILILDIEDYFVATKPVVDWVYCKFFEIVKKNVSFFEVQKVNKSFYSVFKPKVCLEVLNGPFKPKLMTDVSLQASPEVFRPFTLDSCNSPIMKVDTFVSPFNETQNSIEACLLGNQINVNSTKHCLDDIKKISLVENGIYYTVSEELCEGNKNVEYKKNYENQKIVEENKNFYEKSIEKYKNIEEKKNFKDKKTEKYTFEDKNIETYTFEDKNIEKYDFEYKNTEKENFEKSPLIKPLKSIDFDIIENRYTENIIKNTIRVYFSYKKLKENKSQQARLKRQKESSLLILGKILKMTRLSCYFNFWKGLDWTEAELYSKFLEYSATFIQRNWRGFCVRKFLLPHLILKKLFYAKLKGLLIGWKTRKIMSTKRMKNHEKIVKDSERLVFELKKDLDNESQMILNNMISQLRTEKIKLIKDFNSLYRTGTWVALLSKNCSKVISKPLPGRQLNYYNRDEIPIRPMQVSYEHLAVETAEKDFSDQPKKKFTNFLKRKTQKPQICEEKSVNATECLKEKITDNIPEKNFENQEELMQDEKKYEGKPKEFLKRKSQSIKPKKVQWKVEKKIECWVSKEIYYKKKNVWVLKN